MGNIVLFEDGDIGGRLGFVFSARSQNDDRLELKDGIISGVRSRFFDLLRRWRRSLGQGQRGNETKDDENESSYNTVYTYKYNRKSLPFINKLPEHASNRIGIDLCSGRIGMSCGRGNAGG